MAEEKVPQAFQIAGYTLSKNFEDIPVDVIDQLKKHLLDSIASLVHCIERPTIKKLIRQIQSLDAGGKCVVPVINITSLDKAAELYTALIRYPDFMDNFLGKEATCHPSDNIGPLLAAGQVADASGKDFLLCMALGYEIECRLIEEVPVMIKGFDHTLLLSYSVTAALCKMLDLTEEQTAHALSIVGCTFNPLVVCRASYTSEWKGLQSSMVALGCVNAVLLAKQGITGPTQIFEGPKGFEKELGMKLDYDWSKDKFELIRKCILKSYNAEVHTQSLIEAALELKQKHHINPSDIESITVVTFITAYHIVGGGSYGDRKNVYSKEQADHSLPYVIAASLLDGELYPPQFLPERINSEDVQALLQKVEVTTKIHLHKPLKVAGFLDPYTEAYPEKVMGKVTIKMKNGEEYSLEKEDYHGFHTRPLSWNDVEEKFKRLTKENINEDLQQKVIRIIKNLDNLQLKDLISLLGQVGQEGGTEAIGVHKKAS